MLFVGYLNERLRAFKSSNEEKVQHNGEVSCYKNRQIPMLFEDRQSLEEQLHTRFSPKEKELLAQCRQGCPHREQAIREELITIMFLPMQPPEIRTSQVIATCR
ncbi:hypothetical protein MRX96_006699 [Rhipicephalus microplus]|uniref:Uncharacterized protein n=1 Tax=Rhipicephalus microplus TaxID=6941 RepID=A0A9J6DBY4_RHIMP|nr:hypothetical protein HPB51_020298 [Rhipicephalus microplus]